MAHLLMLLFATVPTLSIAPMFSIAPTQLKRSLEFQSSTLVMDLEDEVRVYNG
jgi:hypothetical protein